MVLKAVTLTHVRYEQGDLVGKILAWASLLPVFLAVGVIPTIVFCRREFSGIFFAFGILLSDILNQSLKRYLKIPRPPTCALLESCDSHGMPSAHSQFMSFIATYLTLLVLKKYDSGKHVHVLLAASPWPLAIATAWSRVYLGYHTWGQVIIGMLLGAFLGLLWWLLVNKFISPCFPAWSDSYLGKLFYLKDNSHISNIALFEYNVSKTSRQVKASKSS